MRKNKSNKLGYITLEYVILASMIGLLAVVMFVKVWPDSAAGPLDVANNELVAVIGGNNGDKVGNGGTNTNIRHEETEFVIQTVVDGVSIIGYTGDSKSIIIPSSIGGQKVVEIGNNAFADMGLNAVTLPGSVTKIGDRAFQKNKLKEINLANVTQIGDYAFAENEIVKVNTRKLESIPVGAFMKNKIVSINIGLSVTSIGAQAFANNRIEFIDLAEGIAAIGSQAFYNNCISTVYLSSTISSIGNEAFKMQDGFNHGIVFIEGTFSRFDAKWSNIFDEKLHKETKDEFKYMTLSDSTCAITQYNGNSTELVIPSMIDGKYVVEIKDNVFNNRRLTSVAIPDTVQTIGASAFEGNYLTTLTLSTSVRSLGARAFAGNKLKAIVIPDSLTSFGSEAFAEQDIVNGTVLMSTAAYNRISSSWDNIFDEKLQKSE